MGGAFLYTLVIPLMWRDETGEVDEMVQKVAEATAKHKGWTLNSVLDPTLDQNKVVYNRAWEKYAVRFKRRRLVDDNCYQVYLDNEEGKDAPETASGYKWLRVVICEKS